MEYLTNKISNSAKKLSKLVAHKVLFEGEHMRVRMKRVSGPMSRFTQKKHRCLKCKSLVKSTEALCPRCIHLTQEIQQQKLLEYNYKTIAWNEAWTRCQRCQGSFHKEVVCGNRDCDNFYRRYALGTDIEDLGNQLRRF